TTRNTFRSTGDASGRSACSRTHHTTRWDARGPAGAKGTAFGTCLRLPAFDHAARRHSIRSSEQHDTEGRDACGELGNDASDIIDGTPRSTRTFRNDASLGPSGAGVLAAPFEQAWPRSASSAASAARTGAHELWTDATPADAGRVRARR